MDFIFKKNIKAQSRLCPTMNGGCGLDKSTYRISSASWCKHYYMSCSLVPVSVCKNYTVSDRTDGASASKTVSAISIGGRGKGKRQIFSSSS